MSLFTRWKSVVLLVAMAGTVGCSGAKDNGPGGRTGAAGTSVAGTTAGGGGTGVAGTNGAAGTGIPGIDGGVSVLPPTSSPFMRDDTAMSGLDTATIDALKAGGSPCTVKMLYPYSGTVFPGGTISPPIMWEGASDGAYVKATYDVLDTVAYEFAVGPTSPGEMRLPQDAWNEIIRRTQNTTLKLALSLKVGGSVCSVELPIKIAPGIMTGTVYYNTYSAPGAMNPNQGAVMRVGVGQPAAEIFLQSTMPAVPTTGPCISCHSVSSNGTTMVASFHNYVPFGQVFKVHRYDITDMVQPTEQTDLPNTNFGALYPDGSRILAMGNPQCTGLADSFPRAPNNFPLVEGKDVARVLDTASGQTMAATGLTPESYMWMPQFSPDGKHVVFNDAKPDGAGGTDRRQLAMMDYDFATNTFSNPVVLVDSEGAAPSLAYMPNPVAGGITGIPANAADPNGLSCMPEAGQSTVAALPMGTCSGPCYPAWPFFTPDGKGVVFSLTSEPDFASAIPGRDTPAKSELWYVNVVTKERVRMDRANNAFKPEDSLANYFPTVLPVAVGGYYWAFWTARRDFGNKDFGMGVGIGAMGEAHKKRIWVTSLRAQPPDMEFGATPQEDPSSPGFYLEGQSESGNVRAFAVLNPCKDVGAVCTTGIDCCTGYCHIESGAASGTCTEEVPECAKTNEKCTMDTDCCPPVAPDEPTNVCLGGFCGFINLE
jgi:hypothetical protein